MLNTNHRQREEVGSLQLGSSSRGCINGEALTVGKTNFLSLHFDRWYTEHIGKWYTELVEVLNIPPADVLNDPHFSAFTYGEDLTVDAVPNFVIRE